MPSLFIKFGPGFAQIRPNDAAGVKFAEFPKNNPTIQFRTLKLV